MRIAVDTETLDTHETAALVSVGLVNIDNPEYAQYVVLDWEEQVDKWGRTISPATLKWWLQQSDEARAELLVPVRPNMFATDMGTIQKWLASADQIWTWGSMDEKVLENAYRCSRGERNPDRCQLANRRKYFNARSLNGLFPDVYVPRGDIGVHHNALDDARWLAQYIRTIDEKIRDATQAH